MQELSDDEITKKHELKVTKTGLLSNFFRTQRPMTKISDQVVGSIFLCLPQ